MMVARTGRRAARANPSRQARTSTSEFDHAVAVIAAGDGVLAVAVDDEVGVLDDLPGDLDQQRQGEPQLERPAAPDEPENPVQTKAVDDVGQGVPVGDVLGVLRARHVAVPELDIAALAPRRPAHQQHRDRQQRQQPRADQQPGPGGDAVDPRQRVSEA
jgi:hypothetical protein